MDFKKLSLFIIGFGLLTFIGGVLMITITFLGATNNEPTDWPPEIARREQLEGDKANVRRVGSLGLLGGLIIIGGGVAVRVSAKPRSA